MFLPSPLFASDALLRRQDVPKMDQKSPKNGPRGRQGDPKSAQYRPKRRPRAHQEAVLRAPGGGDQTVGPPLYTLNDRPKRLSGLNSRSLLGPGPVLLRELAEIWFEFPFSSGSGSGSGSGTGRILV